MDVRNPFVGVYHDRSAGVLTRKPIPVEVIRTVQSECRTIDDDMRWLVALVSDTGMRLAEGAGLLKSDIILGSAIPYISLKPHPWRRLKTMSSHSGYTARRGLSMGRSEALRGLLRQPLCFTQIQ